MITFLKKFLTLSISISILLLILSFSTLWYFSIGLPDYKILSHYEPPVSSRVYSGEGKLIAEYATQKRLFIPYEVIPKKVIYAFLSAEDKNFFKHPGVDAKSISRATIKNIKNFLKTKRLEGASTITQQVAKNFLLSNEVSLKRKIKEAILAFRIERAFSKQRIMELYLNQIFLGERTYGIAAASLEYFDKSVSELNYEEAALLAALPKAPSKYNPYKNPELAKVRRNFVIKNLLDNSYINKKEYKKLINKKIKLKKRKIELLREANFYSEEVRRIVSNSYGYDNLYKGGLSIRTPLNSFYQIEALKALREGLQEYDKRHGWRGPIKNIKSKNWKKNIENLNIDKSLNWKIAKVIGFDKLLLKIETENKEIGYIEFKNVSWARKKNFDDLLNLNDIIYVKKIKENKWSLKQLPKINGGIVVMDPFTGRVYALSGGFSFKKSEFNRATQAQRQPGSAFKPFVYALALENNFSPNTLILDAPLVLEQGSDLKMWKPENYGKKFFGPSTLRMGLEKSRNLMTVRIAQDLGVKKIVNFTKQLGIYENPQELLSISLGSAETTLLKLTSAYCAFVNGGKKIKPILIDRIQDSEGVTFFNSETRTCKNCNNVSYSSKTIPIISDNFEEVITPQTAYQITSILEGVIKRGTGKGLRDLNLDLAGKTGTTNENTDTWFIGFTSKLVIGVYAGMDEPKALGRYETGAKTAMPIFKDFVKRSIKKKDARPFKVAPNISMMVVELTTGKKANFGSKETIIEAFKKETIDNKNNAFGNIKDRLKNNNILRFY